MKRTLWSVIAVGLLVATAAAQEKPASPPVSAPVAGAPAPQLPEDVKRVLVQLQMRDAGYAESIAVLQEKRDAVNAEIGRVVQRVQQQFPGYDLTAQLTLVKKADPPKGEKKEEGGPGAKPGGVQ